MSEYQCYEFVALDRPLTTKQVAELRAISTRAEISSTRFLNEYQWGDLRPRRSSTTRRSTRRWARRRSECSAHAELAACFGSYMMDIYSGRAAG